MSKTLTFHEGTRHPDDRVPIGTALLVFCIPSCRVLDLCSSSTKKSILIVMDAGELTTSCDRCDCDCVLNMAPRRRSQREIPDLDDALARARRRPPSRPGNQIERRRLFVGHGRQHRYSSVSIVSTFSARESSKTGIVSFKGMVIGWMGGGGTDDA